MIKTWKFAISTPLGIYQGELTGEQEPGETDEHAMQDAASVARAYIESYQPGVIILACFISDSTLHIDAPGTTLINIDIEEELPAQGPYSGKLSASEIEDTENDF